MFDQRTSYTTAIQMDLQTAWNDYILKININN